MSPCPTKCPFVRQMSPCPTKCSLVLQMPPCQTCQAMVHLSTKAELWLKGVSLFQLQFKSSNSPNLDFGYQMLDFNIWVFANSRIIQPKPNHCKPYRRRAIEGRRPDKQRVPIKSFKGASDRVYNIVLCTLDMKLKTITLYDAMGRSSDFLQGFHFVQKYLNQECQRLYHQPLLDGPFNFTEAMDLPKSKKTPLLQDLYLSICWVLVQRRAPTNDGGSIFLSTENYFWNLQQKDRASKTLIYIERFVFGLLQ